MPSLVGSEMCIRDSVYQGDEKREEQEISQLDSKRKEVMDEYGMGDLGRGESADE